jgi:hypothetical protein
MTKTQLLLAQLGVQSWMQFVVGNSNLPRARNELVAGFMGSGYDDLLFIDDDMDWDPNDVIRLLASEREVIGGVGCKRVMLADTDQKKWCVRVLDKDVTQDAMGAVEVAGVGTGFLKISRCVFERMAEAHPEWKRKPLPEMPDEVKKWFYAFFRFDHDEDGEEYGEDIWFCLDWRRLGGTVWVDPGIKLGHVGEYMYSGDFTAILQESQ